MPPDKTERAIRFSGTGSKTAGQSLDRRLVGLEYTQTRRANETQIERAAPQTPRAGAKTHSRNPLHSCHHSRGRGICASARVGIGKKSSSGRGGGAGNWLRPSLVQFLPAKPTHWAAVLSVPGNSGHPIRDPLAIGPEAVMPEAISPGPPQPGPPAADSAIPIPHHPPARPTGAALPPVRRRHRRPPPLSSCRRWDPVAGRGPRRNAAGRDPYRR